MATVASACPVIGPWPASAETPIADCPVCTAVAMPVGDTVTTFPLVSLHANVRPGTVLPRASTPVAVSACVAPGAVSVNPAGLTTIRASAPVVMLNAGLWVLTPPTPTTVAVSE